MDRQLILLLTSYRPTVPSLTLTRLSSLSPSSLSLSLSLLLFFSGCIERVCFQKMCETRKAPEIYKKTWRCSKNRVLWWA
ncbi:hypothetical protein MANES_03G000151v8 [Manihot esculenta]|uniref:Uncharacterized protein n=1 Tax=Manihot esculenta TaxID=3983 RepID=A0ACB7HXN4_MANES|nr:hypothetical protein MANES_03G000151v8 [Manihot esculenta]